MDIDQTNLPVPLEKPQSSAKPPMGIRLRASLQGDQKEIYRIQWSPDGLYLASPCSTGSINIWNTQKGSIEHRLNAHTEHVYSVSWSPDGRSLVSTSRDKTIRVWDIATGQIRQTLETEDKAVYSVMWSPDGKTLISASHRDSIWLTDATTGQIKQKLEGHGSPIYCLAWSPTNLWLASGSADKTIKLWDFQTADVIKSLEGHTQTVTNLAWSPDGTIIVSGSTDKTIRIWDVVTGQQKLIIEGHTQYVTSVDFSYDGKFLASKSGDGTVRIWRCDTWTMVALLHEPRSSSGPHLAGLQFHPKLSLLATLGEEDTIIRLWDVDTEQLLKEETDSSTIHYANAKVVLVGDTGVGKSGLSLVLTGKPFQETESTHSRQVLLFDTNRTMLDSGVEEIHETLLWDLAGQPGYRLIHQLHLDDISVALVIFDARNEIDPFSGVYHWVRVLHQANRAKDEKQNSTKIFLVAARIDRTSIGVGRKRVDQLIQSLQLDGYFETSAKEGWQIPELIEAMRNAIDWSSLPKVSSSELFKQIKDFIAEEKGFGLPLANHDNLYYSYIRASKLRHSEELRAQFDTCISLIAAKGFIERFSFGEFILLQPELLDSYASALVNAAKNEPDGLGYIKEVDALEGNFPIPSDERVKSKGQEKLLLIATIEKLLRYEIALRVQADDVSYLVFPAQLTRQNVDLFDPAGKTTKFIFEGPIVNIYATLVVRLAQSGLFKLKDLWKNAAVYTAVAKGGTFGISLHEPTESQAELILFSGKPATNYTRYQFEEYIYKHLRSRVSNNTIKRYNFIVCSECEYVLPDEVVELRKKRNLNWVDCPVCNTRLSLFHPKDETIVSRSHWIERMGQVADNQRDRAVAVSTLGGKVATGHYDVFLCHNNKDKGIVKKIGLKLKEHGLLPWLDEWELRPGIPWQKILEQQIQNVKAAAVFVGENGVGPWQDMEQAAFIRQFVQRECPIIPVVLPTCKQPPQLPYFLTGMTWVDFRKTTPNPIQQFIWGITGERNENIS